MAEREFLTAIATSYGNGETRFDRAMRLQRTADVFRAAADDAVAENDRAYERAIQALAQAEYAEREASLAWSALANEDAS
jgi:hypothetical protein